MFALIIAIIAIALTVYLAVSTLFYGGDALSNGSARAIASSFINQGQQINGAHTLYKNDNAGSSLVVTGNATDDLTELQKLVTGKYLSSLPVPQKGAYSLEALTAVQTGSAAIDKALVASGTGTNAIPDEVCEIIEAQAGEASQTFGCFTVDEVNTVWYRL